MSTYSTQRNIAETKGWPVPLAGSDMDTHPRWREAWVRYWHAMHYAEKNPGGGRPVQPHRSGGGTPPEGQIP